MKVSRRFFIGGAAAFGAFGGNRFCEAFGGVTPSKKPNLKFGVVSDVHISRLGADEKMSEQGNYLTFKHALEWYRDRGVDAVLVAGDMTDHGTIEQMKAFAQAWFEVFPDDKAPDGRRVEKLFQMGNHDFLGHHYGYYGRKRHEKEAPNIDFDAWCSKNLMYPAIEKRWREIFNEDYSILQTKVVKGYTFIGHHWYGDDDRGLKFGDRLKAYLDANGKSLDPKLPFFYYQHPHLKDTCYGPWAWGHDSGKSTAALMPFANAIAFSGHSHYSLTDERTIWQGEFTSVGTSSLRYNAMPQESRAPIGYENSKTEINPKVNDAIKMMARYNGGDCRQGMLWSVHDDCIVVERRDFLNDMSLGSDWVMPLTTVEDRPFAFASRAKKSKAPQFPKGAKATIKKVQAKARAKESVLKDAFELTFSPALATPGARPHEYEVTAHGNAGETRTFHVLAEGFNHSLDHKRAKADSWIRVAADRLPPGATHFTVTPLDCWWNKGREVIFPLSTASKKDTIKTI